MTARNDETALEPCKGASGNGTPPSALRRFGRRIQGALAALILAAMAGLLWTSEPRVSPTVDELGHLTRGLAWWWAPDTRLSWPHPPLAHAIGTLPVIAREPRVDLTKLDGWKRQDFTRVARNYADLDYGRARRQLTSARRAMIALSAVTGAFLFIWLTRRLGSTAALVALCCYAFHTSVLSNASLMTNDFAFAACALLVFALLADYLRARGVGRAIALGAALGAAFATKHTAFLLVPLLLTPALAFAARGRGRFEALSRTRRAGLLARDMGIATALVCLSVNAVYRFQRTGMSAREIRAAQEPPSWLASRQAKRVFDDQGIIARLPGWVRLPAPYPYLFGLMFVQAQNRVGHRSFFLGEVTQGGHPAYFPLMFLLKSPLGVLALVAAGMGLVGARRGRLSHEGKLAAAMIVLCLLLLLRSRINIGFRHALLLSLWSTVLAADAARVLLARRGLFGRAFSAGCAGAAAGGALVAYPWFVGDFNLLAGGREGGLRVSVLGEDWMQDVGALAELTKRRELNPLYYYSSFFTPVAELVHQGVRFKKLRCGVAAPEDAWVAIHVSDWVMSPRCFAWMRGRTPQVTVNAHVLVFAPHGGSEETSPRDSDGEGGGGADEEQDLQVW